MNKYILILTLSFNACSIHAQDNALHKTDSVCLLVQKFFNEKNVSGLYELGGTSFKQAITADNFKSVCENNLFPLGKINNTEFEKFNQGIGQYKVIFQTMTLSMYIGLDSSDKLSTFLFKPYENPISAKNEQFSTSNPMASELDVKVDSVLRPYMNLEASAGLSIGILLHDKEFFYGYGETEKGNHQVPDEHTIYEIGSLTKTFTALLLADAVTHNLINLDDPLNKYLPDSIPFLKFEGVPVTLKTMANHTSGLPRMPDNFYSSDFNNPYKDYSRADLYNFYMHFKPVRKPGEKYEYSNLAFGTLGSVLADLYHKDYETLIRGKITGPLGMNETKEFLLKEDSARFAIGYNDAGQYSSAWEFRVMEGAGSLRSTVSDIIKYVRANLGEAPKDLLEDIRLSHTITFNDGDTRVGLSWHYIRPGSDDVIFHNGQTGGYHSYLAINPVKKFAVVILSNCSKGTEDAGGELIKWLENH